MGFELSEKPAVFETDRSLGGGSENVLTECWVVEESGNLELKNENGS